MESEQTVNQTQQPKLKIARTEASEKISASLRKGHELRDRNIPSWWELDVAVHDLDKWNRYNHDLLLHLFDNPTVADEYSAAPLRPVYSQGDFEIESREFHWNACGRVAYVESILERLEFMSEIRNQSTSASPSKETVNPMAQIFKEYLAPPPNRTTRPRVGRKIFVVHGHDDGSKETVARLVEKLGLEAIILHERPDAGRTIIEKLEDHASDVGYAVVLLTADDVGYDKSKPDQQEQRARQNVIFELGFFIGKLTRKHVCALYQEGVHMPSDYQGALFVPIDANGAWKLKLAKEMRKAGLPIDPNKMVDLV